MWTAARMALYRLAYPVELKEEARERYLSYLKEHASEVCDVLIQKKDLALLELICRLQVMERSGITAINRAGGRSRLGRRQCQLKQLAAEIL